MALTFDFFCCGDTHKLAVRLTYEGDIILFTITSDRDNWQPLQIFVNNQGMWEQKSRGMTDLAADLGNHIARYVENGDDKDF